MKASRPRRRAAGNGWRPEGSGRRLAVAIGIAWLLAAAGAGGVLPIRIASDPKELADLTAPLNARERVFAADLMRSEAGELLTAESADALPAGRYRLHVPMAVAPREDPNIGDLSVTISAGTARRVVSSWEFPGSGSFVDMTVEFQATGGSRLPVSVAWAIGAEGKKFRLKQVKPPESLVIEENAKNGAGEFLEKLEQKLEEDKDGAIPVSLLEKMSCRLMAGNPSIEKLQPLAAVRVRANKVLYTPGETGSLQVRVRNHGASVEKGTLTVCLIRELNETELLLEKAVSLAGRTELTLDVPFEARGRWGMTARAVVTQGNSEQAAEEFFNVSDHLWEVCIGGQEPITFSALESEDSIRATMEEHRQTYANWLEKFFWAPDDWAKMTAKPGECWLSSQGGRYENTEKLQFAVKEAHRHGMRMITYGKAMAYNHIAFELARRRPDWFVLSDVGRPVGAPLDTAQLDLWRTYDFMADIRANRSNHPDYSPPRCYPDLRRLDTLDHGIDELIGSAKIFGWDGVRFDSCGFRAYYLDGHTKDGNDAVNIRNMKRLKERVRAALPDFLIGHNANVLPAISKDGRAYPLAPNDPVGHEFREALAGGCLWMGEGINGWRNGSVRYTNWSQYARDESRCILTIKQYGGHFCYSYGPVSPSALGIYKFVIGTMIGAHEYGVTRMKIGGSEHWGKFLTRWSGFLSDARLRAIEPLDPLLSVQSRTPLWWREFARERVVSEERRYIIVHLLNPPLDDEIAKTSVQTPVPVGDCQVKLDLPKSERFVRAMFIAPGYPNCAEELKPVRRGDSLTVQVPRFGVWAMVVWELAGAYVVPPSPPAFTEPMTAAEEKELQVWLGRTVRIGVADNLSNPTPQGDPARSKRPDFGQGGVAGIGDLPGQGDPAQRKGPDFGIPEVGTPRELPIGGDAGLDVLIVRGLFHYPYRIVEAIRAAAGARLQESTASATPKTPEDVLKPDLIVLADVGDVRIQECTASAVPKTPEDIFKYDVIVLADVGADFWNADGHKLLLEFVKAGGKLVVLGGPMTLGQGYFKGTPLEQALPVETRPARDVYRLATPLALGAKKNAPFAGNPLLYYYHAVTPTPDAKPLLWAGELPVLFEREVGKGKSVVFVGTTLGEARAGNETPFWEWDGWPAFLGKLLVE